MFAIDYLMRHGPRWFLYYLSQRVRRVFFRGPTRFVVEPADGALEPQRVPHGRCVINEWLMSVAYGDVPSPAILDVEALAVFSAGGVPQIELEHALREFLMQSAECAGSRNSGAFVTACHLGGVRGLRTVVLQRSAAGTPVRAQSMTPFQWRMVRLRTRWRALRGGNPATPT